MALRGEAQKHKQKKLNLIQQSKEYCKIKNNNLKIHTSFSKFSCGPMDPCGPLWEASLLAVALGPSGEDLWPCGRAMPWLELIGTCAAWVVLPTWDMPTAGCKGIRSC